MNNTKDLKLKPIIGSELNPKWTFDDFVIGPSNQSAYDAAVKVAKYPTKRHNPYIICGKEGCGRTHLMQAIGNYMANVRKINNVFFVSTETFANDLCDAIRRKKQRDFMKKYMSAKLLLVDDIQFVWDKPRTNAELIGVIKKLKDAGRQIVITCAEHPEKILNDMKLGLTGGKTSLVRKIGPPGMRTRTEILTRKAEKMKFRVPQEVLVFLANKITSNVRALESALIRVVACAALTGKKITLPLAEAILHG